MSDTQTIAEPTLVISDDALHAELCIPAQCVAASVTPDALAELLRRQGIEVNDETKRRIDETVSAYGEGPQEVRRLVFEGTPPKHGRDGQLVWEPRYDPARRNADRPAAAAAPPGQRVNFYEQSAFNTIAAGVHLATLVPPSPGRPGRDIYGQPVEPRPGQPFDLQADATIAIGEDGRVVTARAGLLDIEGTRITVRPVLEIREHVDFSTGNVRFEGSVTIRKDVLDQFEVHAAADVEVFGIIGAATIRCGGNLTAQGGMAGKEIGRLDVGGSLVARYLAGVRGVVRGDLIPQREVITSQLTVLGSVRADQGAIVGGRMIAAGPVTVAVLGSAAGIATTLRLGYVDQVSDHLNQLHALVRDLTETLEPLKRRVADMQAAAAAQPDRPPNPDLDELAGTVHRLQVKRDRGLAAIAKLTVVHARRSRVELCVLKAVHPGVIIELPRLRVELLDRLGGPVRMRLEAGQFVVVNVRDERLAVDGMVRITETDRY